MEVENVKKANEEKDKGNKALQEKNYKQAVEHYTNAITLDPSNHIFYSNRSGAYALLEKYEEALTDANKTVELQPTWARGYSRKGAALFFLKKYDEASQAYSEGLKHEPNNQNFQEEIARCRSYQMAAPFLDDSIWTKLQLNPQTKGFLLQQDFVNNLNAIRSNPSLAMTYLQMDQRIANSFLILNGIDLGAAQAKAKEKKSTEQKQEKPAEEKATIEEEPTIDTAALEEQLRREEEEEAKRKKREEEKEKKKKEEQKKKEAEKISSRKQLTEEEQKLYDQAQVEKQKGNEFYMKKQFDKAIEHYEAATKIFPKEILYMTNKAACYMELKQYEKSVEICEEAIKTGEELYSDFESIAKAYERKGNALCKLERYEEAIAAYEKSLTNNRAQNVVKILRETRDKFDKQQKLAYINPAISEEERIKGNEAFKAQKYPEAIKHYTEAIKRNPSDPTPYTNRATAYMKLGEYPLALQDSDKALELNPKNVKAWTKKGQAHHWLKQYHKAMDAYDNGLKHDPNNEEIKQGIISTTNAIRLQNQQGVSEEQRNRALQDPEIQNILRDPAVQKVLQTFQSNPNEANRLLSSNPTVRAKIDKLVSAGVVSYR